MLNDRTREELEDQLDLLQKQVSTAVESLQTTLEADRAQLHACLKNLEEAQTARKTAVRIIVFDDTATGKNTRLIAGTDTNQLTIGLSVTHNRATDGASMAAGVHSADSLKALFQQSPASAPAISTVQMMQMGRFDVNSPAVQDLLHQQTHGHRSETTPGGLRPMPRLMWRVSISKSKKGPLLSTACETTAVNDQVPLYTVPLSLSARVNTKRAHGHKSPFSSLL